MRSPESHVDPIPEETEPVEEKRGRQDDKLGGCGSSNLCNRSVRRESEEDDKQRFVRQSTMTSHMTSFVKVVIVWL